MQSDETDHSRMEAFLLWSIAIVLALICLAEEGARPTPERPDLAAEQQKLDFWQPV